MKILYISNSIIPSKRANSINVMKMCQAFADNGNQIILLAPNKKKEFEKNIEDVFRFYGVRKNFTVKKLWYPNIKGGAFFYTLSILLYILFNNKFDLIYGRFLYGCYLAPLFKIKVIYESHAPIDEETKYGLFFFRNLVKSKFFKKLIVISQSLKDLYLEKSYLLEDKIDVAHDGADEVVDFNSKIKLNGKKNNLKVGYVGHLHKGKGMEVISSIANRGINNTELHIIGGLEKDINFWKNKIQNKNTFFYGFVSHSKTSNYINALDICLLPNQKIVLGYGSVENGMNLSDFTSPLKLFEYMSHKKAIIASDLSVLKEILDEKNSIIVKSDDIHQWINAIEKLRNPILREKIAKQALKDFSNYTWKKRANKVILQI